MNTTILIDFIYIKGKENHWELVIFSTLGLVYLKMRIFGNMNTLAGDLEVGSSRQFIDTMVRFYEISYVEERYRLTNRERDFFVLTVLGFLEGSRAHHTEEGRKKYEGEFSRQQIADYMRRVKKKQWIQTVKTPFKEVRIPRFFTKLNPKEAGNINIKLLCSAEETN